MRCYKLQGRRKQETRRSALSHRINNSDTKHKHSPSHDRSLKTPQVTAGTCTHTLKQKINEQVPPR